MKWARRMIRPSYSKGRDSWLTLSGRERFNSLGRAALVGGSPGDGIAGPPAHMIAFQASHSSRSASRILASAAVRISTDSR